MKAELVALSSASWRLVGQVEFSTAENLADALVLEAGISQPQRVDLQQASGGSALLLVLLAWQRRCLALGVQLELLNPPLQLQKVAELSHLQNLLPLVLNTKQLG